eukprot:gene12151-16271_t
MEFHRPDIFESDKKQTFGVTDAGEFLDNVYREQNSNALFGKMIGRTFVAPHSKKVFTQSDVVCEGYLYKQGSWMRNWKKRYFILRKDIRSLCYFNSREDLTLLGSIPLDIETKLTNVKPEDCDGHDHVVSLETELDNGQISVTLIRFETFNSMKAWMIDIKNEAHNITATEEEQGDWWSSLFDHVAPILQKTNAPRRDGVIDTGSTPSNDNDAPPASHSSHNTKVLSKSPSGNNLKQDEFITDLITTHAAALHRNSNPSNAIPNGNSKTPLKLGGTTVSNDIKAAVTAKHTSKKIKAMKIDKPYGPPPFETPTVDKFQTSKGALSGLQISLRMCNVCGYQDRIFVVLFGRVSIDSKSSPVDTKVPLIANGGSKWNQISRTELRVIKDKPEYGDNYVSDYKIHFSVVQDANLDDCKEIKIVVYRLENEMNPKEPAKATNLNMQLEIAKTVIPKKLLDTKSVVKVAMQLKVQLPMDIAIPSFKEPEVALGIVRLCSASLAYQRTQMTTNLNCKPYSEVLYSLSTNTGQTFSLEQIYASRYSASLAQALLGLWHKERFEYMMETIYFLKEEMQITMKENETAVTAVRRHVSGTEAILGSDIANTAGVGVHDSQDSLRSDIEVLEEVFNDSLELASMIMDTCDNAVKGNDLVNNVISADVGGGVLRRSVWKKITAWQYCTTNLNVHLLLSKFYSFNDIIHHSDGDSSQKGIHCIPSITLGCPAAHELKYSEGGLKKIFAEISDNENRLKWMHAIQSPTMEYLKTMIRLYPKEATSLFGNKNIASANFSKIDIASILKRKYELARRIDICGSQALGCAITSIKTLVMLTSQLGGKYKDILARSLKIGFIVMFQSMLSTQGDELGMIEDLEVAVLWLSLVTVRLVGSTTNSIAGVFGKIEKEESSSQTGTTGSSGHVGRGEGVVCRRDVTGRLIVDLEISSREGNAVIEALGYMHEFSFIPSNTLPLTSETPFAFSPNPVFPPVSSDETKYVPPKVFAVTEIIGLAFTQGVNEMQTLANLSSSRDVSRQVEINIASLTRIESFYKNYRLALEFQLRKKAPELIDAVNREAINGMSTAAANFAASNSTNNRLSAIGRRESKLSRRLSARMSFSAANGHTGQSPTKESLQSIASSLTNKVLASNDKLMDQLAEAVSSSSSTPFDKHVSVLLRSSALCREIQGIVGILCKS